MNLLFFVSGMFCGTCARSVVERVTALEIVTAAGLDYGAKLLSVEVTPGTDEESAVAAIERAIELGGFSCRRQPKGWTHGFSAQLAEEQRRAVPPWLVALVFFFAMWSSVAALAKYLGGVGEDEAWLLSLISTVLGAPAILLGAFPFARAGLRALLKSRLLTLDLFIGLGACAALGISILSVASGGTRSFADSGAMILVVLLLAKSAEARTASLMTEKILYHLEGDDTEVLRIDGDVARYVSLAAVRRGHSVVFAPGQTIAFDGEVMGEDASIDTHLLNGESRARTVAVGERVLAGAVSLTRTEIRVTEPLGNRLIDGWAEAALSSSGRPSRYGALLRRCESGLTGAALLGASLLGAVRWIETGRFLFGLEGFFVGVLLFCPCLFASILPLSKRLACVALERKGILVYRPEALFDLAHVEHVFTDKTGTLERLESRFVPSTHHPGLNRSLTEVATPLLKQLRRQCAHPILRGLELAAVPIAEREATVEEFPGAGVSAVWSEPEEKRLVVGRPEFVFSMTGDRRALEYETRTVVAVDGRVVGFLESEAEAEAEAFRGLDEMLNMLPPHGTVEILSGDPDPSAEQRMLRRLTDRVSYHGNLSPEEKAARIRGTSLFVGDGLNDTPALAQASVSVRLGERVRKFIPVDIQLRACGVERLPQLINYAKKFERVLVQTAGLAAVYNLAAWTLAFRGLFTPLGATFAMAGSLLLMLWSVKRLI